MRANKKCILGISPGTRIFGIAVIQDGELVEWKVKTFKEKWSSDKRKAILNTVTRLCDYHGVSILSIKKVDPLRSSPGLTRLVQGLIKNAKRQHIKTQILSLSELDYDLRTGRRQTKATIAESVAENHPEIKQEYQKERNNRREYYTRMFEAIALAEDIFKKCHDSW